MPGRFNNPAARSAALEAVELEMDFTDDNLGHEATRDDYLADIHRWIGRELYELG